MSERSGSRVSCKGHSRATAGSDGSHQGRYAHGGEAAIFLLCLVRRFESGGGPVTAREVVLERIRRAVADAAPVPVSQRHVPERSDSSARVVTAFATTARP